MPPSWVRLLWSACAHVDNFTTWSCKPFGTMASHDAEDPRTVPGKASRGVRKEMHKLKGGNDAFLRISSFQIWTFYNKLCTFIGMESQKIYTNIHPTFCLSKIPNIKYPKTLRWRCQPCKDARVHYSFVEPGGQEWWKCTAFLGNSCRDTISVVVSFSPNMLDDFPGFFVWRSMTRRVFRWILLDLERVENEEKIFWMQRFTGGFGSHQHGSWAATLPCLRGWDRRDKGVKRVDKKAGKPWIFREGLRR